MDGNIDKEKMKTGMLQMLAACAGVFLIFKMAEISWCAPPAYELLGGRWKDVICSILDFYLLVDMDSRKYVVFDALEFSIRYFFDSVSASLFLICFLPQAR